MSWEHLPRDTAAVVRTRIGDCRNLGLILDRFNPWAPHGDGWDLSFRVEEKRKGHWTPRTATGGEAKGMWLSNWQGDGKKRPIDTPLLEHSRIDPELLAAHHARWAVQAKDCGAKPLYVYTETRLVVGLGADSVLETSLTLHRTYGFPIIPGSALKGLARLVALLKIARSLGVPALTLYEYWLRKPFGVMDSKKTPLNKLDALLEAGLNVQDPQVQAKLENQLDGLKQDPALPDDARVKKLSIRELAEDPLVHQFRVVFGFLGQTGEAIFFDGVPRNPPRLVPDVMNPHYPKYYQESEFPHDGDQPVPISFLAVAEGTYFGFAVAPRRRNETGSRNAAQNALIWLAEGLSESGVGAKTAAGYGLFGDQMPITFGVAAEEPKPPAPTPDPIAEDEIAAPLATSPEAEKRRADLAKKLAERFSSKE